nr:hypothetical protein Iba_chr02dCG8650 [Ipomoea batatas]
MQPGEHSVSEQELHKLACNNAPTITHSVATLSSPKTPKGKRKHFPSITSLSHDRDGKSKRPYQSGEEVIYIDDGDIEVQGNNAGGGLRLGRDVMQGTELLRRRSHGNRGSPSAERGWLPTIS